MNRRTIISFLPLLFLICILNSCERKPEEREVHVSSRDELVVYLDSLEQRYEKACLKMGLANWNSYAKEAPYDLDASKASLAAIFMDTTARAIIDDWRGRSKSLADKLLARRLELWHRCFLGGSVYANPAIARLENRLQQTITNYRFTVDGVPTTRARLNNALREEKKQAVRKKLWAVPAALSAVAVDDLRHLVSLRNQEAITLGFPNYYSLSLHLNAIDESWLLKTLESLEEQSRPPYKEYLAEVGKKYHLKEVGPWDLDFVLRETVSIPDKYFPADSVFAVLHSFQRGIGFPIDSLPIREVVKDIPYGGLSLAIHIPDDSRFLLNPTKGKSFYASAFHEYGHSLKCVHTNVEYPILKGYEWVPGAQCAAYEEGTADVQAEFTNDSLWLATFTRARPKQIDRYLKNQSISGIVRLRRLLKDFSMEYAMYKNPLQDLAALERSMIAKYMLTEVDSTVGHQFAASIWYTSYPCYYQNYILAGMIATQLQEALSSKFESEKISSPNVAVWMIDHLYAGGETYEWTDRIRNATGKSLETGPYLRKLNIDQSRLLINN